LLHEAVSSPAQNVQFTVLHSFTNNPDGASPSGCLVEGSDGAIYGATESGGTNVGTFYKIYKNGDGYVKLADLNLNSYQPAGGLLQASNGLIYGVTTGYGIGGYATNDGTLFSMNGDGSGYFTPCVFPQNNHDVAFPVGHLIQAIDGGLYGISESGGANGDGTIYRFDPNSGQHSVVCSFTNNGYWNARNAGLIQGKDGLLYGTTYSSVMPNGSGGWIFKINTNGTGFNIIFSLPELTNNTYDYANPQANLIQASDGVLYGTTYGASGANVGGTVFKINTDGTGYSVIHEFGRYTVGGNLWENDGSDPVAGLLEGTDGTLYGTTSGTWNNVGFGTIFKVNKDGSKYAILHTFSSSDGVYPDSSLLLGSDGALYGTSQASYAAYGTIFRLVITPELSAASTNGTPQITLFGLAGQNCQIQISTNLISWASFTNLVLNTDGLAQFTDGSAGQNQVRFYRTSTQ